MKFSEFDLHPDTLKGIESQNFEECTPIQGESIPHILAPRDVAGLAQTGTGKTAAYVIPLIDRILWSKSEEEVPENYKSRVFSDWKPSHYILILVPTRELAEQVKETVRVLGGPAKMQSVAIFGGTSYEPQKKAINRGVEFVVATPGRLIDLYKEKVIDLSNVRAVVFDEADRMFDMGFKNDTKYILQRISPERQFLVFSATLNFDVLNIAYEFGSEPVEVNISRDQTKAENVKDEIFHVGSDEKPKYLLSILKKYDPKQVIIFSNFKRNVERIAQFLTQNGFPAMGISSLLTQAQRQRVISQFKAENDRNIMVATDVAARGLDIKGVDMVLNYELPDDAENYVHRIGRTGRASQEGVAFSFVSDRDVEALMRIEEYLENKVGIGWLEDSEFVEDFKAFPRESSSDRYQKRDSGSKKSGRRSDRRDGAKKSPRKNTSRGGGERKDSEERESRQHRDRRTGRHKNKRSRSEEELQNARGPRSDKDGARKSKKKNDRRKSYGKSKKYTKKKTYGKKRTSSKKSAAPSSLGQKVSNFFKNLFQ